MKTLTYLFAIVALGACGGASIDPTPAPPVDLRPVVPSQPEPVAVVVPAAPKPTPTPPTPPKATMPNTIATGIESPANLALDETTAYFTSLGKLFSCKKSGCGASPTVLATSPGYINSILVTGGEVFFSTDTELRAVPIGGGATRTVSTHPGQTARGLTIDETTGLLYWAVGSTIVRCSKTCATGPTTITWNEVGESAVVVAHAGMLYWAIPGEAGSAIQGTIRGCAIDACTPHTFADHQNVPQELVVTDTSLHWVADGASTVRSCSLPDCATITDAPRAGQTGLVVDDGRTYWSYAYNSWIWTCTGVTCEQPAEFAAGILGARSMAIDDTNLYVAATGWSTDPSPYVPNLGYIAVLPKLH